jgi:hypothetical protein
MKNFYYSGNCVSFLPSPSSPSALELIKVKMSASLVRRNEVKN